jgi:hypothetical protein
MASLDSRRLQAQPGPSADDIPRTRGWPEAADDLLLHGDFDGERWRQRRGEQPYQTVHDTRSRRTDAVVGMARQTRALMNNPSERERRGKSASVQSLNSNIFGSYSALPSDNES